MKRLISYFLFLACALTVAAQPKSIGGKVGTDLMVSYQHEVGNGFFQIDFGGSGYKGLGLNVTYNWAKDYNNWLFYGGFGVGGGFDFYNQHEWCKRHWVDDYVTDPTTGAQVKSGSHREVEHIPGFASFVGVVGSAGVQYEFPSIPLAIGIEYQPLIGVNIGRQNDRPGTKTAGNEKLKYGYHLRGLYEVNITARYLF